MHTDRWLVPIGGTLFLLVFFSYVTPSSHFNSVVCFFPHVFHAFIVFVYFLAPDTLFNMACFCYFYLRCFYIFLSYGVLEMDMEALMMNTEGARLGWV